MTKENIFAWMRKEEENENGMTNSMSNGMANEMKSKATNGMKNYSVADKMKLSEDALSKSTDEDIDKSMKIFAIFFDVIAQIISWTLYFVLESRIYNIQPWYANFFITLAISRIISFLTIRNYKRKALNLRNNPSLKSINSAFAGGLGFKKRNSPFVPNDAEINTFIFRNKKKTGEVLYDFGLIIAGFKAALLCTFVILILRAILGWIFMH